MRKCNNPTHHTSIHGNNKLCNEHTLRTMENLCLKRQVKLTPQRKSVVLLMLESGQAMSAYDLLDRLRTIEPKAKPPTIYRSLDFLMEQGFIHKVESLNTYMICPHFDDPEHISILFICDKCKLIVEEHSDKITEQLNTLANSNQFKILHSVIEIHGKCKQCR